MDGKVIDKVEASQNGDHTMPALDGLQFHDQSRFQSAEVTRAFASVVRADSLGAQSEVSEPNEVTHEPHAASSELAIVRGVD